MRACVGRREGRSREGEGGKGARSHRVRRDLATLRGEQLREEDEEVRRGGWSSEGGSERCCRVTAMSNAGDRVVAARGGDEEVTDPATKLGGGPRDPRAATATSARSGRG